jgi:hypothetical protein
MPLKRRLKKCKEDIYDQRGKSKQHSMHGIRFPEESQESDRRNILKK